MFKAYFKEYIHYISDLNFSKNSRQCGICLFILNFNLIIMSKIGNQLINIPEGVTVKVTEGQIQVSGPKGHLQQKNLPGIRVDQTNNQVQVTRESDNNQTKAFHGLIRSLINNMILGVTQSWSKNLELIGTGYRAKVEGKDLSLSLGYSHPIVINAPEGISFKLDGQSKVTVEGIDKQLVGQIAAQIRAARPPEPYKGKGVRYEDEKVRRKAGKAAAGTTA